MWLNYTLLIRFDYFSHLLYLCIEDIQVSWLVWLVIIAIINDLICCLLLNKTILLNFILISSLTWKDNCLVLVIIVQSTWFNGLRACLSSSIIIDFLFSLGTSVNSMMLAATCTSNNISKIKIFCYCPKLLCLSKRANRAQPSCVVIHESMVILCLVSVFVYLLVFIIVLCEYLIIFLKVTCIHTVYLVSLSLILLAIDSYFMDSIRFQSLYHSCLPATFCWSYETKLPHLNIQYQCFLSSRLLTIPSRLPDNQT